jgi:hypothetical protein
MAAAAFAPALVAADFLTIAVARLGEGTQADWEPSLLRAQHVMVHTCHDLEMMVHDHYVITHAIHACVIRTTIECIPSSNVCKREDKRWGWGGASLLRDVVQLHPPHVRAVAAAGKMEWVDGD